MAITAHFKLGSLVISAHLKLSPSQSQPLTNLAPYKRGLLKMGYKMCKNQIIILVYGSSLYLNYYMQECSKDDASPLSLFEWE